MQMETQTNANNNMRVCKAILEEEIGLEHG